MEAIENWCSICGNVNGGIRVEGDLEAMVEDVLQLEIADKSVCSDCDSSVNRFSDFKAKANQIQYMFKELQQPELTLDKVNEIRSQFGLKLVFLKSEIEDVQEIEVHAIENPASILESDLEQECESESTYKQDPIKTNRKKIASQKTENEKLYEFKCHVCGQEFLKMQPLVSHCRDDHDTTPQVLCWCGTILSTWKRLMAHKSKHTSDDNELSCRICNISYKKRTAFEKHNMNKHSADAVKFICSVCGKEFKEKQILRNHEKIHLPDELKLKHPCNVCEKSFVNSHCLKIHIARVHEKVPLHTCELCGKGCITKSDLKWHMDCHVITRNFECDICHLKFKSANSLRIHKRRHFNQDKVIVCQICGKEFGSSASLSNHKLVHSDVKRYKCSFCGNEYKRLESYKCHLNSTHTGERPFSCLWCNRKFVNSANCRKHKLKDHPIEVAAYEAIHGKRGVSLSMKMPQAN